MQASEGWRRGWDSNPRALSDKTLSRRPRYDHFGTSPFITRLGGAPFPFPTSLRARGVVARILDYTTPIRPGPPSPPPRNFNRVNADVTATSPQAGILIMETAVWRPVIGPTRRSHSDVWSETGAPDSPGRSPGASRVPDQQSDYPEGAMRKRTPRASSQETCDDVGTLWTMRRLEHVARCALMSWASSLEVRVLVDGEILLSERCDRAADAFMTAEGWTRRARRRSPARPPRERARPATHAAVRAPQSRAVRLPD